MVVSLNGHRLSLTAGTPAFKAGKAYTLLQAKLLQQLPVSAANSKSAAQEQHHLTAGGLLVLSSDGSVVADVTEIFNLSDIGSALTPKDDDVATSVATALMCVICMSEEKSIACVPCGHKCLCEGCGNNDITKDKCPICREPIGMFMRVFE